MSDASESTPQKCTEFESAAVDAMRAIRDELRDHRMEFQGFVNDFKNQTLQTNRIELGMVRVEEGFKSIVKPLQNLSSLASIDDHLNIIKDKLLDRATQRAEYPSLILLACIAIIGITLVVVMLKDTDKSFKATRDGFSLEQSPQQKKTE